MEFLCVDFEQIANKKSSDECLRIFVVGGTGREPERAKAGYHYGSGILPFAIFNSV